MELNKNTNSKLENLVTFDNGNTISGDNYDLLTVTKYGVVARRNEGGKPLNQNFEFRCVKLNDPAKKLINITDEIGENGLTKIDDNVKYYIEKKNTLSELSTDRNFDIFDKDGKIVKTISAKEYGYLGSIDTKIKLHKNYFSVSFDYDSFGFEGPQMIHEQSICFDYNGKMITNDKKNQFIVKTTDIATWGNVSDNCLLISNLNTITNKLSIDKRNSFVALYNIKKGKIVFNSNDLFAKIRDAKNIKKEDFTIIHTEKCFVTFNYKKTCLAEINLATGKVSLNKKYLDNLSNNENNSFIK